MNTDLITTRSAAPPVAVRVRRSHYETTRQRVPVESWTSNARSHQGFTLIEMLVCIAILAVMMAMALPAIQNARESARATYCRSNLAQVGEAFQAYHLTHGSLPSGSIDAQSPAAPGPERFVWGWALQLLPQLNEQVLAAKLDPARGIADPVNRPTLEQTPEFLTCPSGTRATPIGYAGCHHDVQAPIQADNNGILTLNSHVRFDELTDGLHQTCLLGEAADVRWAEGASGSLRNFGVGYGEAYVKTYFRVDPETESDRKRQLRDTIREELAPAPQSESLEEKYDDDQEAPSVESAEESEDGGDTESDGDSEGDEAAMADDETDPNVVPEPSPKPDENDGQNLSPIQAQQIATLYRETGFWPIHRDSGHFLLADGSVRSISKSASLEILRKLANRYDHLTIGEF